MKERLNAAVVGCGTISGNHLKALRETPGAALGFVCDVDRARLDAARAAYGVPGTADYADILKNADIDVVHLCVPHHLHADMTVAALRAGKHVLCEKPMAICSADAEKMARASEETGRALGVCFQNRYNEANLRVKRIIDTGELGALRGGGAVMMWDRSAAYYARDAWRGKWATEGGGVLINQAIHTLDLLRIFAGGFADVKASLSAKRLEKDIEVEDTADLLLQTPDGRRFTLYATNCASANLPVQITLHFDKGDVFVTGNRLRVRTEDGEACEDFASAPTAGKDYWGSGHARLICDFYRSVRAGEPFFIAPRDAMQTTVLLDKAYAGSVPSRARLATISSL